jgi:hypothetical protein
MYTEAVLRASLVRFHVTTTCLSHLLTITATLPWKINLQNPTSMAQLQSNSIASAICDILAHGLRQKIRILPSTLTFILEVSLTMLTSKTHNFELLNRSFRCQRTSVPSSHHRYCAIPFWLTVASNSFKIISGRIPPRKIALSLL